MITDYVRQTPDIWDDLIQAMMLSLTNERRGLSYGDLKSMIEGKVLKNFETIIGTDPDTRTVEQIIIYAQLKGVDYLAITQYYYTTIYMTAENMRITQADAHNEADEFQEDYLTTEKRFFEDKYLDIFHEFSQENS